jgi:hypothetical protein
VQADLVAPAARTEQLATIVYSMLSLHMAADMELPVVQVVLVDQVAVDQALQPQ